MEYKCEIDELRKVIFVRITGDLEKDTVASMGLSMRQLAEERGFTVLFDLRKVDTHISVADTYNWFPENYDVVNPGLKRVATAHLISPRDVEHYQFVENTWKNRGGRVKVFTEEAEALAWLVAQNQA